MIALLFWLGVPLVLLAIQVSVFHVTLLAGIPRGLRASLLAVLVIDLFSIVLNGFFLAATKPPNMAGLTAPMAGGVFLLSSLIQLLVIFLVFKIHGLSFSAWSVFKILALVATFSSVLEVFAFLGTLAVNLKM